MAGADLEGMLSRSGKSVRARMKSRGLCGYLLVEGDFLLGYLDEGLVVLPLLLDLELVDLHVAENERDQVDQDRDVIEFLLFLLDGLHRPLDDLDLAPARDDTLEGGLALLQQPDLLLALLDLLLELLLEVLVVLCVRDGVESLEKRRGSWEKGERKRGCIFNVDI